MGKALFWFAVGYFTARYLILKYGTETYLSKESAVIGSGKEKINEVLQ